ncbi:MAG: tetratricopeptide repeat protein, partial [Candidatus Heimdallarchaeota archaeon]|nr:tetratricopeptide repeat protein [Candidatus Heimdallarchaeota archaeon]
RRLNPSFNGAHVSLAKVYMKTGEIDEAIDEINLYFEKNSDNPEAYELAAIAYLAKMNYVKSEGIMDKAIKMFPERMSAKIILADIYIEGGKIFQAESVIENVMESDAENIEALHLLAKIKHKQGNIDELINTYRRILELEPDNLNIRYRLGLVYVDKNDLSKAREIGKKFLESKKDRPEGPYLMGLVYFREKKTEEAITSLKNIKGHPGAYYYLGLSYLFKGNLDMAGNAFQEVINLRPKMVQANLMLAVTHLRNGKAEDAEKVLHRVLDMEEKNAFAHNLLGSAFLVLGKGE